MGPGCGRKGSRPVILFRLGAIGITGMERANVRPYLKITQVEVTSLCDVDRDELAMRAKELLEMIGSAPTLYGD